MQKVQILLTPSAALQTATTINSDLQLVNGYLVNSTNFVGNGLVNEFTVTSFLNNSSNVQVATDFFNFLQINVNPNELKWILQDNGVLASLLNDFYNQNIGHAIPTGQTSTQTIQKELSTISATTYSETDFDWNSGNRIMRTDTSFNEVSGELSFYIPIILERQTNQIFAFSSSSTYDPTIVSGTVTYNEVLNFGGGDIKTRTETKPFELIQSFVNLNLDDNESEYWVNNSRENIVNANNINPLFQNVENATVAPQSSLQNVNPVIAQNITSNVSG